MGRQANGRLVGIALGAGVLVGMLYTLSPLTVLSVPLVIAASVWAARGLTATERRWFVGIMAVAVVTRLMAIGGLLLASDDSLPYATLFGDERFFTNRTLWMRNIGLGVPVSPADFIYAFEDVGRSSYLYYLALLQALVGEAPYGVHVANATAYVCGVLLIFRMVRPVFGGVAALGGLSVLLFLPSLFVWSISTLKEPLYTLVAAVELVCAVRFIQAAQFRTRLWALVGLVAGAAALESLRQGSILVAIIGVVGGAAAAYVVRRPRFVLAAVVLLPLVAGAALATPSVQARVLPIVRGWAFYHNGHVNSAGYSYKILDRRYYYEGTRIFQMPGREAGAFMVRAVFSYLTEPLPWHAESRAMLAYLPEQMAWYVLLAFVPFGLWAGLRQDAVVTCLLAAHAFAVIMMVAMTSGNIGTLIRHRGLALPYLAWLAALGVGACVRAASPAALPAPGGSHSHVHG